MTDDSNLNLMTGTEVVEKKVISGGKIPTLKASLSETGNRKSNSKDDGCLEVKQASSWVKDVKNKIK